MKRWPLIALGALALAATGCNKVELAAERAVMNEYNLASDHEFQRFTYGEAVRVKWIEVGEESLAGTLITRRGGELDVTVELVGEDHVIQIAGSDSMPTVAGGYLENGLRAN